MGIIKSQKTTTNSQILREKLEWEKTTGERFHYINGDYSWGFSCDLGFLDTIDHPFRRGKGSTIDIGNICLDKVAIYSSI